MKPSLQFGMKGSKRSILIPMFNKRAYVFALMLLCK